MSKLKTKSSAKKRFKLTATGKLKRQKAYHSHILTKKSPKRKRRLLATILLHPSDETRIKKMLGL